MKSGEERKTFSKTTRELVRDAQHGRCDHCSSNAITDYHHRVPNTKTNNRLYPYFLHSIFNCVGLCRNCHDNCKHNYNILPDMAMAYNVWLGILFGMIMTEGTYDCSSVGDDSTTVT